MTIIIGECGHRRAAISQHCLWASVSSCFQVSNHCCSQSYYSLNSCKLPEKVILCKQFLGGSNIKNGFEKASILKHAKAFHLTLFGV